VVYDRLQVTYGQLLRIFFAVAHDPTQLNRQGPDIGTSYRSAIFYSDDEQKKIATAYIAQLDAAKVFPQPILTQVVPLRASIAQRIITKTMLCTTQTILTSRCVTCRKSRP
jgi:peptide-methionine (S)-S-oxide reductase